MIKVEDLKVKIEKERCKLDELVGEMKLEESYQQSLVLDGLIEEYISLTTE